MNVVSNGRVSTDGLQPWKAMVDIFHRAFCSQRFVNALEAGTASGSLSGDAVSSPVIDRTTCLHGQRSEKDCDTSVATHTERFCPCKGFNMVGSIEAWFQVLCIRTAYMILDGLLPASAWLRAQACSEVMNVRQKPTLAC
eukprot:231144-Amphidinium_carterae.1